MQKRVLVVAGGMIAAALLLLACPALAADTGSSDVHAGEPGALQKRVAAGFVQTGRQHLEAGRVKEAIEDFTAALSFDPAQTGARKGLAAARTALGEAAPQVSATGDTSPAEVDIIRAQASLKVLCESARQMLVKGEHRAAVEAYEKVLAAAKPLARHVDVAAVTADANRGLKQARAAILAKEAPKPAPAADVVKRVAAAPDQPVDNSVYDNAMEKAMRVVADMRIPQTELLTRPTLSAAMMSRARRRTKDHTTQIIGRGAYHDADDEEVKKVIEAKLVTKRVSVSFKNQSFASAIEYIQAVSGVNIMIDPAVLPSTVLVKGFSVSNMRLDHVLRHLLRYQRLDYRIQDGAIYISNTEGLAQKPITVLHDITYLTMTIKDFHAGGKPLGVIERSDDDNFSRRMGIKKNRGEEVRPARDKRGHEWAEFIRENVRPSSWGGENAVAANTIAYRNGKLVVTHTTEVQEQIRELLSSFRKARAIQVAILARFIEISENFLEDFGVSWSGGSQTTGEGEDAVSVDIGFSRGPTSNTIFQGTVATNHEVGLGTVFVDSAGLDLAIGFLHKWQVHMLVNAVRKENQGNLLTAPRVTCFNTQRAFMTVSTVSSYVRSYDTDGNPEIGQVNDGIVLEVQPFVSADRRYITLELIPQVNQVGDFQTFSTLNARGTDPLTGQQIFVQQDVQLPEVTRRQVMTTVSVPDGGTLMIGGLAQAREGRGVATVPILGDLPLIKYLFTSRRKIDARNNLIILVTAHIIQQGDE